MAEKKEKKKSKKENNVKESLKVDPSMFMHESLNTCFEKSDIKTS